MRVIGYFFDPKHLYKITLFIIDSGRRVSLEKTEVSNELLLFVGVMKKFVGEFYICNLDLGRRIC